MKIDIQLIYKINSVGALSIVISLLTCSYAHASQSTKSKTKTYHIEKIKKEYDKIDTGEKNITSAMSIIGGKKIKEASSSSSIYSILKITPSVNEYQQNIGSSTPVFSVRGVRTSELAETLDGIPIQSLLNGGIGAINSYNIGSIVSVGQIDKIHIYPGVAPPDRSGFATVGGTISFNTIKPSKKRNLKIFSSIGSFSTDKYGAQLNSGKIIGSGGLRLLLRYSKTTTGGYIEHTPASYRNILFSLYKPYNYGLSHVDAVLIYNHAQGELQTFGGIPQPLQNKYGLYYNYPLNQTKDEEQNNYLTAIFGDRTYINRHIVVGAHVYYIKKNGRSLMYSDPNDINAPYPYQQDFYLPLVENGAIGIPGYPSNNFTYNPVESFGSITNGEDSAITNISSQSIGVTPKVNIFLPHNNITIGGLLAEETGTNSTYVYGTLNMPEVNGYNASSYGTKYSRDVYSGYLQDKITLFDNRLSLEPGVTVTGVSTSNNVPQNIFDSPPYGYKLGNYSKALLPYFGISYDLTKNVVLYSSYGKGARFAPLGDYVLGSTGSTTVAPNPETVNAYEAGVRYISRSSGLYLNFDGYIQNMKSVFDYTTIPSENFSFYGNSGSVKSQGLEASADYDLTSHINLSGNVSYNQTKFNASYFAEDDPSAESYGYVTSGDPEADVPNWLLNASITYHRSNFSGTLSAQYTGNEIGLEEVPTTDVIILNGVAEYKGYTPDESINFGNYFLLNGHMSYKIPINNGFFKSIKLNLNVDNILDRRYLVHYDYGYKVVSSPQGYIAQSNSYGWDYPGMPRFIEVGFSANFF